MLILNRSISPSLIRYAVNGFLLNTAAYLLYLVATFSGVEPKVTVLVMYPVGVAAGFFVHGRYSFTVIGDNLRRIRRFLLAHLLGWLTNFALLYCFSDVLGFPHQVVQFVAIFVVALQLFLMFKFYVYLPANSRLSVDNDL